MEKEKSLKQKFLDGEKLNLLENMRIKIARKTSDCDEMCEIRKCEQWYCETYKEKYNSNKKFTEANVNQELHRLSMNTQYSGEIGIN